MAAVTICSGFRAQQYSIGTCNVKSMNPGKLEVVKQEMVSEHRHFRNQWTKMNWNGWILIRVVNDQNHLQEKEMQKGKTVVWVGLKIAEKAKGKGEKCNQRTYYSALITELLGLLDSSPGTELPACHAGGPSSIPGLGRSPREGISYSLQYSWTSLVAETVKNPPAIQETWVWSLGWKDPLKEGLATHSSILAWRNPMDRGAWWATVHGVPKSWTRLSN